MSARQYPKVTLPEELKPKLVAALQSYASQQLSEKDKEIAELKKSQQPEVSEDRIRMLSTLLHLFWSYKIDTKHGAETSIVWDYLHTEEAQKLISQLFEPQPVSKDKHPFADILATCSPEEIESFKSAKIVRSEPQPVQGESDEWVRCEDGLPDERKQVLCLGRVWNRQCQQSWEEHTDQNKDWFKKTFTHWRPLPSPPKANK
jgi:hypothetical protein